MRLGRVLAAAGVLGGAVTAWEARAVARVAGFEDPGGRADHATTIGEGVGDPLRLLLLGDSAVDGYGLDAGSSLPRQLGARLSVATGRRVRVRSVAVSGATTADVVAFQLPLLRASAPVDAVLVGVGVNDVLRRTGAGALEEQTWALAGGLHAIAPGAAHVVAICPDLSRAPGLGPVLRRVVGLRCRAVADRQRRILEESSVPVVGTDGPVAPGMLGEDGLHPGPAGVVALATAATTALVGDRPATAHLDEGP